MRSKASQRQCLKTTIGRVRIIADGLLAAPRESAKRIETGSIPRSPGIYLWQLKKTGKIHYIGVALGRNGLRQRVGWQHLRVSYKISVFRIKVADHFGLDVGQQCVEHIKSAYRFAYLVCDKYDPIEVRLAEAMLVTALKPAFNGRSFRVY